MSTQTIQDLNWNDMSQGAAAELDWIFLGRGDCGVKHTHHLLGALNQWSHLEGNPRVMGMMARALAEFNEERPSLNPSAIEVTEGIRKVVTRLVAIVSQPTPVQRTGEFVQEARALRTFAYAVSDSAIRHGNPPLEV